MAQFGGYRVAFLIALGMVMAGLGIYPSQTLYAQGDWWQRSPQFRTRYYNVKTDLGPGQAKEIANHLDRTFESYLALFAGLKLRRLAKLDVYVFATQQDYLTVLRQRFQTDGTGSGGMCITRGNLISLVAWKGQNGMDRLKGVLQHEGFHQFASNLFPSLPTWANEGLAEVFERGVLIDGKIVLGEVGQSDIRRLQAAKRASRFRSINEIINVRQADWNHQLAAGNAGENYLQAWSLVHCFLYAENARYQKQFMAFLQGINNGLSWERSFLAAFGVPDFESINVVWLRYIDSLPPMDYAETIRRMDFLSAGYMQLRDKKIYPRSLEQLREKLAEIGFEYESSLFGSTQKLTAADEKSFQVPFATAWKTEPEFELVDTKGNKPDLDKKVNNESSRAPKPLLIRTSGLAPLEFQVGWEKDRKSLGGQRPVFTAR